MKCCRTSTYGWFLGTVVDKHPRSTCRDVHEAFLVETEARPRPWSPWPRCWQFKLRRDRDQGLQSLRPRWGQGIPTLRRDRTEALPRDWGIKTEATSHIHIIPRTDVVLKRSGGSLELRLNQSGIFKHNLLQVMLKCLPQDWGIKTEATSLSTCLSHRPLKDDV